MQAEVSTEEILLVVRRLMASAMDEMHLHHVSAGAGALVGALIFDYWGSYDWAFMLMLVFAFVAMGLIALGRRRPVALVPQARRR